MVRQKVDRTAQKPKKMDHAEKSETAGEFHFLHKDAPLSSRRHKAAPTENPIRPIVPGPHHLLH
jgi:hypothetical protein